MQKSTLPGTAAWWAAPSCVRLQRQGYNNIITRTHKELDLCRQENVEKFFAEEKPEYVFLAAAKVGGIVANQEALADFMWFNMTLRR